MCDRAQVLGTVLAGGGNRRFGSHKALATLGGVRLIDRVVEAVDEVVGRVVLVANDLGTYGGLGIPVRQDARPGTGVLGGVCTAVRWACEEGFEAALVVACDMPFLSATLLAELIGLGRRNTVAAPASDGPRTLEPLCAVYGVGCLPAIEAALDRGDRSVVAFFPEVEVRRLEREAVGRHGDPAILFLNVNRPEDRARAEVILSGSPLRRGAAE